MPVVRSNAELVNLAAVAQVALSQLPNHVATLPKAPRTDIRESLLGLRARADHLLHLIDAANPPKERP